MKRDETRLRRKKETLGMDDTVEILETHGSEGSDERGSRDPITQQVETSIAQRSAPDLVLWSDEPGALLEPVQEERKARGKSVQREKATHELTHTQASEIGAVIACEPQPRAIHITDNHTKSQSS